MHRVYEALFVPKYIIWVVVIWSLLSGFLPYGKLNFCIRYLLFFIAIFILGRIPKHLFICGGEGFLYTNTFTLEQTVALALLSVLVWASVRYLYFGYI
jgi:hypothetical protein